MIVVDGHDSRPNIDLIIYVMVLAQYTHHMIDATVVIFKIVPNLQYKKRRQKPRESRPDTLTRISIRVPMDQSSVIAFEFFKHGDCSLYVVAFLHNFQVWLTSIRRMLFSSRGSTSNMGMGAEPFNSCTFGNRPGRGQFGHHFHPH